MILTLRQRLIFFICFAVFGFVLTSVISSMLIGAWGETTRSIRICTVIQDMLMLIIPALATALISSRKAASFLQIEKMTGPMTVALAILSLVLATPAMNCLVKLNESVVLPEPLEQALRAMEANAAESVILSLGEPTVGNLIVSILIVGVLAGFGEELFFRGTLQRLMTTGGVNKHLAIWTAAAIFSAVHFQFYGFIPRLMLGAYFGYLLVWSRSLWLPVIAHAANNIMYVVWHWVYSRRGLAETPADTIGADGNWTIVVLSALATGVVVLLIYRFNMRRDAL